MKILGINIWGRGSSAGIVADGELVAAAEEEHFRSSTSTTRHFLFPRRSIAHVVEEAGLYLADVDHIAIATNPQYNSARRIFPTIWNRVSSTPHQRTFQDFRSNNAVLLQIAEACGSDISQIKATTHTVGYADAHIASGYQVSPFVHAAILCLDAAGDHVSTVLAAGNGEVVKKHRQVHYPHSLWNLHAALSTYLGFMSPEDEQKIMALGLHGKIKYLDRFRQLVRRRNDTFELDLKYFHVIKNGVRSRGNTRRSSITISHSRLLENLFGPARHPEEPLTERHADIAASLQRVTEEIVFYMLHGLHQKTDERNLVVVGNSAMNAVTNEKILAETAFENIYVPCAPSASGTAIGAAFHVWTQTLGERRSFRLDHAEWGPSLPTATIRRQVQAATTNNAEPFKTHELAEDELLDHVVNAICNGKAVGWMRGRTEIGERSFGNSSILTDPRRPKQSATLESGTSLQLSGMSILEDYASNYVDSRFPCPFMERVVAIRQEKRSEIPGVANANGWALMQTVSEINNTGIWPLIHRFYQRTGVPILSNDSMVLAGQTRVHSPADAMQLFLNSSIDMLVLGTFIIERVGTRSTKIHSSASGSDLAPHATTARSTDTLNSK